MKGPVLAILRSDAGPGFIFSILLLALLAFSPLTAAVIIGSGAAGVLSPVFAIALIVAIVNVGRWFAPLLVLIVGASVAIATDFHFFDESDPAPRAMFLGFCMVFMGSIAVTICRGLIMLARKMYRSMQKNTTITK